MLKRYKKSTLRIRKETMLGFSSMALSLLIALALIFPLAQDDSYATCVDGTGGSEGESCASSMAETALNLTANTAISVSLGSTVDLELTPTSTGITGASSTNLMVSTNSKDGYAIFMQTGDSTGNLKNIASEISDIVANTSQEDVSLSGLDLNSYGYALTTAPVSDSTTYSHLPTDGEMIHQTNTVANLDNSSYAYGDNYYLSFGVKIGTDLTAGTYSGKVIVSAVANPKTLASMFDLTYMQDMTSEICANTREHYTKQLIDVRDGNSYWVAKLKDGNC